jgi:hypothetical protein
VGEEILRNEVENPDGLGKELMFDNVDGKVPIRSFLTWHHTQMQALQVIDLLCQVFPKGVEILEHYSDYFRMRLERHDG